MSKVVTFGTSSWSWCMRADRHPCHRDRRQLYVGFDKPAVERELARKGV
jgi:hypothetical protein